MLDDFESRMEARDIIRRSFACVDERDQAVVIAREVYSVPLRDLADEYGVSVDRVRKLEARGLRKARAWLVRQLRPDKKVRELWRWRHGLSRGAPVDWPWRAPVDRNVRVVSPATELVEVLIGSYGDDLELWRFVMGEIYRGGLVIPDDDRASTIVVRYPPIDPVTQQVGPVVYSSTTRVACKAWVDSQGWAT